AVSTIVVLKEAARAETDCFIADSYGFFVYGEVVIMLTDMTPTAGQLYGAQIPAMTMNVKTADHPSLRGTPLAMLAAQCNKLSSKSPPPLADAAVGKGFHPWKKSPQGAPSPGATIGVSSSSSSIPSSQRSNSTYSRSV
ncbi:unnamed protein product, partial [Callosobruchus maculatus]